MQCECRGRQGRPEGGHCVCSDRERETSLLQPDFLHQQSCKGWRTRPITPTLRVKRQQTRDERFAPSHANGSTRRLGLALALTEAAVGCFPPKTIQPLACFRPHTPLANNNFPSFKLSHQTHPSTTTARVLILLFLSSRFQTPRRPTSRNPHPPNSCPRFRICARSYVPPPTRRLQAPETNTRAPRLVCFAAKTRPC